MLVTSAFHSARDTPSRSINQECATHNRYPAHPFCKHPNQRRPPGEYWIHDVELIKCEAADLAARHARRRPEEVRCKHPPWLAEIDHSLSAFCAECEHGSHGDTISSATFMMTDFETKKNQWAYRGRLSQAETQLIQQNIEELRHQYDLETQRGPWNNSYWVLGEKLHRYTVYWENYVNNKLEAERQEAQQAQREAQQQAQQRQEAEMYRDIRLGNRISAAMETTIYAPGHLTQLEASRVDLPGDSEDDFPAEESSDSEDDFEDQAGPSSQSRDHRQHHGSSSGRHHKPSRMARFFGGGKKRRR